MEASTIQTQEAPSGLRRELGLFDSTMLIAGSMIGSGVFIASAEIARQVGCAGWILAVWSITGVLTVAAALSYGELAAMIPRAGGQYVYLGEAYSPLWGFLYGWTLFLVIQTGTIAAVAVGFAKYLSLLLPSLSSTTWLIRPIHLSTGYAITLSVQQLVAILLIVALTWTNTLGLRLGKIIQNVLTSVKAVSLIAMIVLVVILGRKADVISANFSDAWTPRGASVIRPDLPGLPTATASGSFYGLLIALCVAQVGSLFSSDAWSNITFTAGEVRNPRRNLPLSLGLATAGVTSLYVLANLIYLLVLPVEQVQHAPEDRVATVCLERMFGPIGAVIMAAAIVISTLGCNNGMILAGARVYYAMARDGLFFRATGRLNVHHVPAVGLVLQGLWACLLVLPRTLAHDAVGREIYGNLYGDLLEYVIFAVLIFYVLTITAVFVLRRKRPDAERPYRAVGYPIVPAVYIGVAAAISLVLLLYRTRTSWPGLAIVLAGIPVYFVWRRLGGRPATGPAAND